MLATNDITRDAVVYEAWLPSDAAAVGGVVMPYARKSGLSGSKEVVIVANAKPTHQLMQYEGSAELLASFVTGWQMGADFTPTEARMLYLKSMRDFASGFGSLTLYDVMFLGHAWGHSCVAAALGRAYDVVVPHGLVTVAQVTRYCQSIQNSPTGMLYLVIVRMSGRVVKHVGWSQQSLPVGTFTAVTSFGEVTVEVWNPRSFEKTASQDVKEFVCNRSVDGWCTDCDNALPKGKVVCRECGYVVTAEGHASRCDGAAGHRSTSKRAAQLGDAYHRIDVLCALMFLKVDSAHRTVRLNDIISARAQARYMRSLGHSGEIDSLLSTTFEAEYFRLRHVYLETVFPNVPMAAFQSTSTGLMGSVVETLMRDKPFVPAILGPHASTGQVEKKRVAIRGFRAYWDSLQYHERAANVSAFEAIRMKADAATSLMLNQLGELYASVKK